MNCWLCKNSEDDFQRINEKTLSEIGNNIAKLKEEIKVINEKIKMPEIEVIERKHLETRKGQLNKKIKKLNIWKEILKGKFYDYNIFGNEIIDLELAKLITGSIPKSFTKDYAVNPTIFGELKICHYCKTIIEQIIEHSSRTKY